MKTAYNALASRVFGNDILTNERLLSQYTSHAQHIIDSVIPSTVILLSVFVTYCLCLHVGELIGLDYLYQQTGDDFAAELQRHKELIVSDGDGEDDDADDPTETAPEVSAVKEEDEITIELDTEDFSLLEQVMSVDQPKPHSKLIHYSSTNLYY